MLSHSKSFLQYADRTYNNTSLYLIWTCLQVMENQIIKNNLITSIILRAIHVHARTTQKKLQVRYK